MEAPTPFFNAEDSNNFNFNRKKPEEIQSIIPKHKALQHFPSNIGPIKKEEFHSNVVGTPSICSIEDKLQYLVSPAFSDRSAGNFIKNKNDNRFLFAEAIN